jgi:DNA-binding beta-propeller fold protein YncE
MKASWVSVTGILLAGVVVLGSAGVWPGKPARAQLQRGAAALAEAIPPHFESDPSWLKPLSPGKSLPELKPLAYGRPSVSVATDSHDHVWILQVPSPESRKAEAAGATIPRVFAFDSAGNLVQGWGGPGKGYQWMENPDPPRLWPAGTPAEHGIFVDHKDNVWVTGNGHVALKFSHDGKFLLQIGELWKTGGSNDRRLLGSPTDLAVEAATNEVYIADGYINRRVAVFDADTGAYKRHWGAYGKRPNDLRLLADQQGLIADPAEFYLPGAPPPPQFLSVHGVRVSKDGFVYVCDRNRNRVQVFRRDGTYVSEFFVEPDTPVDIGFLPAARGVNRLSVLGPLSPRKETAGFGAPSTVAFSSDPEQRYLYVGDNQNHKIMIYRRRDLQLLGSIPTDTGANHYIAVDSKGNIYNTRLQKFVFKGVPTLHELLNR